MRARNALAALALLGASAWCAEAGASPLFELAGGTTSTGGFNARVTGAGTPAAYFNPALLSRAEQGFELGWMVLSDQVSLTLDGRTGGNVPLRVGDRGIIGPDGSPIPNDTVPTDWLESGCSEAQCGQPVFRPRPRQADGSSGNVYAYQVAGLVAEIVPRRFVFGFHAIIPLDNFTTADSFYNDEREQFFSNSLHPEMYGDRLTATSLSFGLGSEIVDGLSIGIAATLRLKNQADADTYVRDPVDYDQLQLTTDVEVKTSVDPHFGVMWEPTEALRFVGTFHTEQRFEIVTRFGAALPGGNESDTQRTSVHSFVPWQAALGAQYVFNQGGSHEIGLVGHVKYAAWSNYVDRHGERPDQYGDAYAWENTISPTLGIRHTAGALSSFLDVTFVPSPVPEQTGRSNYVDNDRWGANIGTQYTFELWDLTWRPGIQLQAHRLPERYQRKNDAEIRDELPDDSVDATTGQAISGRDGLQTNNPGWPGFASDGWILGGVASIGLLY